MKQLDKNKIIERAARASERETISLHVDSKTWKAFCDFADNNGLKRSTLFDELVKEFLSGKNNPN